MGKRDVDFDLAEEIPIDSAHTLDQLTSRFQSVKDGLPELIKNSKDHYARLGVRETEDRQIVVIADPERCRIAVIDFAGARSEDFDGWTTWSSRFASKAEQSEEIEGGHGNGGKAFMVRGSTTYSFMDSCARGRRTKMGFRNDVPVERYKPGYGRLGKDLINNLAEPHPGRIFLDYLKEFGLAFKKLPLPIQQVFEGRDAFTIVLVDGVRDWVDKRASTRRRIAEDLPGLLSEHGQTAMAIETCSVWVIVDGGVRTSQPIKPRSIASYTGFENLPAIPVPDSLTDPETGDLVDTGKGGAKDKFLQLFTSEKNLRLSDDLKTRNVIRIWNHRNNVATWSVPSLGVLIPAVAFTYGKLRVPALTGEHLSDAHRTSLADTPLARALQSWVSEQVEALATRIAKAEMQKTKPQDRDRAARALQGLRDLMRKFLQPEDAFGENSGEGSGGGGKGSEGEGRRKKREPIQFGDRLDEITLEPMRRSLLMATGTSIPLTYRCYELSDDKKLPVKGYELVLKSEGVKGLALDSKGVLRSTSSGSGTIWLESSDGKVKSNRTPIETIECTDVDVALPSELLLQGQQVKLAITFRTNEGSRDGVLIEASIDEPAMAWIGRAGMLTTGLVEGTATIRVRFAADPSAHRTFVVRIGPERAPVKGRGGDEGANIPEILLCGEDAPGMDGYPPDQRSHHGGEHFPTIIEEPQFQSIVWINPNSKEAARVRASRGGPSGAGGIGTRTFIQFIALKCFEILKRLKVRQEIGDQVINETQFTQLIAEAEMECAGFIDAAYEVSETLLAKESGAA